MGELRQLRAELEALLVAGDNICDDMTARLMQISCSAARAGDAPASTGAPPPRTCALSRPCALARQHPRRPAACRLRIKECLRKGSLTQEGLTPARCQWRRLRRQRGCRRRRCRRTWKAPCG